MLNMSKKLSIILMCIAGVLILIYIFIGSYETNQENKYNDEKDRYESTKDGISSLKHDKQVNNTIINKVESDPSKISKDALETADHFVKNVQKSNKGTDKERHDNYQKYLKPYTTSNIIDDDKLLKVRIPDNYKLYPGTEKGRIVKVLLAENSKDLSSTSHYTEISVDTIDHQVTGYKEYNVRSKAGEN